MENKKDKLSIVKSILVIVLLTVAIIGIIFNMILIKNVVEKTLSSYDSTSNLDNKSTLILDISQNILEELKQVYTIKTQYGYIGPEVNGKKSGVGTYKWKNGNIYEGEFYQDLMHGTGKLTIAGEGTYEGQFVKGKRTGKGTFLFVNGDIYTGEWTNDKMEGDGKYTFANGDYYEGQFSNNKFNGQGTYCKNGVSYTGKWKDNVYNK